MYIIVIIIKLVNFTSVLYSFHIQFYIYKAGFFAYNKARKINTFSSVIQKQQTKYINIHKIYNRINSGKLIHSLSFTDALYKS